MITAKQAQEAVSKYYVAKDAEFHKNLADETLSSILMEIDKMSRLGHSAILRTVPVPLNMNFFLVTILPASDKKQLRENHPYLQIVEDKLVELGYRVEYCVYMPELSMYISWFPQKEKKQ